MANVNCENREKQETLHDFIMIDIRHLRQCKIAQGGAARISTFASDLRETIRSTEHKKVHNDGTRLEDEPTLAQKIAGENLISTAT